MTSVKHRIDEESQRDPDTLEREAEAARHDIADTIDLLEQRLSPGQLLDRALNMSREHAGEFAGNLGRSIKYHPVPLLLTAVGISWLAFAENRPPAQRGDGGLSDSMRYAGDAAHSAMDSAREKAGNIAERVHGTADSMRTSAARTAEQVRHQSERVRERFEHALHEQPLVLGALGLALGAILGGVLPRSHYENRTIGEYGDRLRAQASETAETVKQTGQHTAEAATQTVQSETTRH